MIENIPTEDSPLLIDYKKLSSEGSPEKYHFEVRGMRCADVLIETL